MCVVVRVCVYTHVCGSVCVSVARGDPAVYGRVPVHLPRHGPNVFRVAVLNVDGIQRAAVPVPGPAPAHVAVGVMERGVALHVGKHPATRVSIFVPFPV